MNQMPLRKLVRSAVQPRGVSPQSELSLGLIIEEFEKALGNLKKWYRLKKPNVTTSHRFLARQNSVHRTGDSPFTKKIDTRKPQSSSQRQTSVQPSGYSSNLEELQKSYERINGKATSDIVELYEFYRRQQEKSMKLTGSLSVSQQGTMSMIETKPTQKPCHDSIVNEIMKKGYGLVNVTNLINECRQKSQKKFVSIPQPAHKPENQKENNERLLNRPTILNIKKENSSAFSSDMAPPTLFRTALQHIKSPQQPKSGQGKSSSRQGSSSSKKRPSRNQPPKQIPNQFKELSIESISLRDGSQIDFGDIQFE